MENNIIAVDLDTWKRAAHYLEYKKAENPKFALGFELDITRFIERIKEKKLSFYYSLVYAVTRCANEIEEFRYRIKDGRVVLYKRVSSQFRTLEKESELFKDVTADITDSLHEFVNNAEEAARSQTEYFQSAGRQDVYRFTCIPWISFTCIAPTESGDKDDAVPLIIWGKYYRRDGRLMLPFYVKVHHAFVDGVHIGKLAEILQRHLNDHE